MLQNLYELEMEICCAVHDFCVRTHGARLMGSQGGREGGGGDGSGSGVFLFVLILWRFAVL